MTLVTLLNKKIWKQFKAAKVQKGKKKFKLTFLTNYFMFVKWTLQCHKKLIVKFSRANVFKFKASELLTLKLYSKTSNITQFLSPAKRWDRFWRFTRNHRKGDFGCGPNPPSARGRTSTEARGATLCGGVTCVKDAWQFIRSVSPPWANAGNIGRTSLMFCVNTKFKNCVTTWKVFLFLFEVDLNKIMFDVNV